jgi:uncharacterized delta-60 repeat protein
MMFNITALVPGRAFRSDFMKINQLSRVLLPGLLTLVAGGATVIACDDTDIVPPVVDAGTDSSVLDTGLPAIDSGVTDSGVTDTGSDGPGDTGSDAGVALKPVSVALEALGHDRFLNVTYDSAGNFYAVGTVIADTSADSDVQSIVVKFNAQGQRDTTFGTNGVAKVNLSAGKNGEVTRGIVIQSTGKIVIAGAAEVPGNDPRDRDIMLARFDTNGTLDTAFGTAGIKRLNLRDGELVNTTYVAEEHWGLTLVANDELIVTSTRQQAAGATLADLSVAKLTATGDLVTTFGKQGVFDFQITNTAISPRNAKVLGDGSLIVSGYFTESSIVRPVLFKLTGAGALDTGFGTGGVYTEQILPSVAEAYGVAVQGTEFVTVGYGRDSTNVAGTDWVSLRVKANGTRDMAFGDPAKGYARIDLAGQRDNARAMVVLPDNRLLYVGGGSPAAGNVDSMVVILKSDGTLDTSFGNGGKATFDLGGPTDFFWGVALAPSGKQVAVVGHSGAPSADAGTANDDAAFMLINLP